MVAARQRSIWQLTRPLLDLMQTMPVFVYLIPAVMLFSTGAVPSVIATLIFAMPPVHRWYGSLFRASAKYRRI